MKLTVLIILMFLITHSASHQQALLAQHSEVKIANLGNQDDQENYQSIRHAFVAFLCIVRKSFSEKWK